MVKKHAKPSQDNPQGGILDQEAPIHSSNVMLVDPKTGERTRVGFKEEDGKKSTCSEKNLAKSSSSQSGERRTTLNESFERKVSD